MDSQRFRQYLAGVKEDLLAFSNHPFLGAVNGTPLQNLGTQILAINSLLADSQRLSFKAKRPEDVVYELLVNRENFEGFLSSIDALGAFRVLPLKNELPATIPLNLRQLVKDYEQLAEIYQANKDSYGEALATRQDLIGVFNEQIEKYNQDVEGRVERAIKGLFPDIVEEEGKKVAKRASRQLLNKLSLSGEEIGRELVKKRLFEDSAGVLDEVFRGLEEEDASFAVFRQKLEALPEGTKQHFAQTISSEETAEAVRRSVVVQKEALFLNLSSGESTPLELYADTLRGGVVLSLLETEADEKMAAEIADETARRIMARALVLAGQPQAEFRQEIERQFLEVLREKNVPFSSLPEYKSRIDSIITNVEGSVRSFGKSEVAKTGGVTAAPAAPSPTGLPTLTDKSLFGPFLIRSSSSLAEAVGSRGGFLATFFGTAVADAVENPIGWTLKGGPILAVLSLPLDALPANVKLPLFMALHSPGAIAIRRKDPITGKLTQPGYLEEYFDPRNIRRRLIAAGIEKGSAEWERATETAYTMRKTIRGIKGLKSGPAGFIFDFYSNWWRFTNPLAYLKMQVFGGESAKDILGYLGTTYLEYFIRYGSSPALVEWVIKHSSMTAVKYLLAKTPFFTIVNPRGFKQFVFVPTYRLKEGVKNVIFKHVWQPLKKSKLGKAVVSFLGKKLVKIIGGAALVVGGLAGVIWKLRKPLGALLIGIIAWFGQFGTGVAIGAGAGGLAGGIFLGVKGAAFGASIGSVIPFFGTAIGGAVGFVVGFTVGVFVGGTLGATIGYLIQLGWSKIAGLFGGGAAGTGIPLGTGAGVGAGFFPASTVNLGGLIPVATVVGTGAATLATIWITSSAFIVPEGEKLVGVSEYFEVRKEADSPAMHSGTIKNEFLPQKITYKISLSVKNKSALSDVEIEDILVVKQKRNDGTIETREIRREKWDKEKDSALESLPQGAIWESKLYIFNAGEKFADSLLINTIKVRAKTEDGEEEAEASLSIRIGESPLPQTADLADLIARILIYSCDELASYRVNKEAGGMPINGVIINKENWAEAELCLRRELAGTSYGDQATINTIVNILGGFRYNFDAMQCVHFARAASLGDLPSRGSAKDYCADVPAGAGYILSQDWDDLQEGDFLVNSQGEAGHIAVVTNKDKIFVAEAIGTGAKIEGVIQYNRPIGRGDLKNYCGFLRKK